MSKAAICVVVPVYKAMATLDRCVESVLAQQVEGGLTCILVDDGSTDGSPALCDAIAAGDQRFVAIHQPNSGVCAARTAGLRRAQELGARWYAFCDADDLYHPELLDTLYAAVTNSGLPLACCRYDTFTDAAPANSAVPSNCKVLRSPAHLDALLHDHAVDYGLWNKLFSADLLTEEMLDNGLAYNEDLLANWRAFLAAPGCAYCDFAGYHYRQHAASASHTQTGGCTAKAVTAADTSPKASASSRQRSTTSHRVSRAGTAGLMSTRSRNTRPLSASVPPRLESATAFFLVGGASRCRAASAGKSPHMSPSPSPGPSPLPCPAIVPAASGPEQVVVNGMSPSNRGSRWSNSGMVVEIQPEDIINDKRLTVNNEAEETFPELAVLHFQEELERQCWLQGGRRQTAPAQRMVDFTRKKLSYDLPESSYSPGLISSPLHFWMPEFIAGRLSQGFQQFGRSSHGFLTNEAVMIGVETRTSSPVRIVRDKDTLQHITLRGLFPCGEGAGYAGGIVSAGIDGERCAEAVAQFMNP